VVQVLFVMLVAAGVSYRSCVKSKREIVLVTGRTDSSRAGDMRCIHLLMILAENAHL